MTTPARQRVPVRRCAAAWLTTIGTATGGIWFRVGTSIDALVMRAGIAAEVNAFLIRHMFRAPIIVVPGSPADWVFLTGDRTPCLRAARPPI